MKITIALCTAFATFAAGQAFAVSQNDTWDTIRSCPQVTIRQTELASKFGPTGFFNACVAGKVLRSIKPITSCAETAYAPDGTADGGVHAVCVRYENKKVELPLQQTATGDCADYEQNGAEGVYCARWNTVSFTLSTAPDFKVLGNGWVFEGPDNGSSYKPTQELFTKTFPIPSCN
jgi:hypothetical protein